VRISVLSAQSGLPIDTIRFYEKRGLLDARHVARDPNGYRRYSRLALERLNHIREAKSAGFTLGDIERMLNVLDGGRLTPSRVRVYCDRKLSEVDSRIAELQQLRKRLRSALSRLGSPARNSASRTGAAQLQGGVTARSATSHISR